MTGARFAVLLVLFVLCCGCSTTKLELTAQEKLLLKERGKITELLLNTWLIEIDAHDANGMLVALTSESVGTLSVAQEIPAEDAVQGASRLQTVNPADSCLWVYRRSILQEPSVHSCRELKAIADREVALNRELDKATDRIRALQVDLRDADKEIRQLNDSLDQTARALADMAELFRSLSVRQTTNDQKLRINKQKFDQALAVLRELQDATSLSNEELQTIVRQLQDGLAAQ